MASAFGIRHGHGHAMETTATGDGGIANCSSSTEMGDLRAAQLVPGPRRVGNTIRFRVWAPGRKRLEVVFYRRDGKSELCSLPMEPEAGRAGWFAAELD